MAQIVPKIGAHRRRPPSFARRLSIFRRKYFVPFGERAPGVRRKADGAGARHAIRIIERRNFRAARGRTVNRGVHGFRGVYPKT
jgi:hypothetical protein